MQDQIQDHVGDGVAVTVPVPIRQTVAAVEKLQCEAGVSVTQLAQELKLDKSTISHRVKKALSKDHLKNLEEKKGRAFRLELGEPMPNDVKILPAPVVAGAYYG